MSWLIRSRSTKPASMTAFALRRPLLVGLEVLEADVVELDVDALLEQLELEVDVALVAVVADHDPVRAARPRRAGS